MSTAVYVVIPNLNGGEMLIKSIDSVLAQSFKDFRLVIVDNGSKDNAREIIERYQNKDSRVLGIFRDKNYGYTGGVNPGLELAIKDGAEFAATFNNDAVAHRDWLKHLVEFLRTNDKFGAAACSLQSLDGGHYDSTGDIYTTWGLPYPRGRGEPVKNQYDEQTNIFGASGGASMFRMKALLRVGIFDQDFFAYYEDIDLGFRLQLAGWPVAFVPKSIVYHAYNTTSSKIKGFTTYQTIKNLPWVIVKNVPARLYFGISVRFTLAYAMFIGRALLRGQGWWAIKGFCKMLVLLPKKFWQRHLIQKSRKVSSAYISSILTHDLPPNAHNLRTLRNLWRRITFRRPI